MNVWYLNIYMLWMNGILNIWIPIIFLIVSANLQLQQITDLNTVENADIVVGGDFDPSQKRKLTSTTPR